MVHEETVEWFLHGASIQLQQRPAVRHHSLAKNVILLPTFEAPIITGHTRLEASLDAVQFAVELVLHAEHSLVHILVRASPALGRIKEGFESLCELLRPISLLTQAINLNLPHDHYSNTSACISRRFLRLSTFNTNTPTSSHILSAGSAFYYYTIWVDVQKALHGANYHISFWAHKKSFFGSSASEHQGQESTSVPAHGLQQLLFIFFPQPDLNSGSVEHGDGHRDTIPHGQQGL